MKKYVSPRLIPLFVLCFSISCRQLSHGNKVSLTVSDSETEYEIRAHYPEANTDKVAAYLNRKLGNKSDVSFHNATIDAKLTFDDGTTLYMKNEPGYLDIQFDKEENTPAAFHTIKELGEGLKPMLNE